MPAADAGARALASTAAPRTAATTTTTGQAGTPAAAPQSPATAGTLGGAVFALVLVVGLILLLSWLAKRMPGLGGGAGAHPSLRIVGALALGPRDRLVVVEVGETQLLLGVGAGGTRTLHTLDQPLPTATAKSTPAFAQLLARHLGKKTP
ncbi:flagellar biosynthetic protein FliO [Luteimonas kalidii]|uniref:flagellar biosynthetic protein FliO n=1 Tax=Luteimonas kalidii TaxID=3042025 RepID=UPI003CE549D0